MFNLDFHTEHHNVPGPHWSELPALAMSPPASANESIATSGAEKTKGFAAREAG